jgi:hypothetical protein
LTLFTKAKLPTLLDVDPTAVRLGAEMESMLSE